MKLEFSQSSNIKVHENTTSGSRAVPCGQTDGRTDMTKAIFAFRNFAKEPKKQNKITRNGELLVLQCSRSWTQSIATSTNKPQLWPGASPSILVRCIHAWSQRPPNGALLGATAGVPGDALWHSWRHVRCICCAGDPSTHRTKPGEGRQLAAILITRLITLGNKI
jgi:hypothetical protein